MIKQGTKMSLKIFLIHISVIGPIIIFLFRLKIIFIYLINQSICVLKWLFNSKETTNFTFDLSPLNDVYLVSFIANITNKDYQTVLAYFNELENNQTLIEHIEMQTLNSKWSVMADKQARFGRRKGWYALIRILKPKVVVETGVDKGLGACVIASALMQNRAEGFDGYYYGTDINSKAGYLFSQQYKEFGEILYGDSIESLNKLDKQIDIFINDSDHSMEYEANEYEAIKDKLSSTGVILGDNSQGSDKLFKFSIENNRNFIFFQEQFDNQWFPGGGIGVSFKKTSVTPNTLCQ
jgi:predicted O-methyltransferase YrrM